MTGCATKRNRPWRRCALAEQDRSDLLVWYSLSWMGEFTRRESPLVRRLMEQANGFTVHDRRELLALIGDEIAGLLPRYRKLAEQGKIELSITPWSHPILPLLLDFESAGSPCPMSTCPAIPIRVVRTAATGICARPSNTSSSISACGRPDAGLLRAASVSYPGTAHAARLSAGPPAAPTCCATAWVMPTGTGATSTSYGRAPLSDSGSQAKRGDRIGRASPVFFAMTNCPTCPASPIRTGVHKMR